MRLTGTRRPLHRFAWCVAAAFACAVIFSVPVLGGPPHIDDGAETDACAMCHRTHTSASDVEFERSDALGVRSSALAVGNSTGIGDVGLCYVCHGVDQLGATTDIQSSFLASSTHSLAPSSSPYGPSRKQCSDCHDSHGGARTPSGTPYPALLRSRDVSTGASVYRGDEYCAACHIDREDERWDGLATYRGTVHGSVLQSSAPSTAVSCSGCHVSHGSPFSPLLRTIVANPAGGATRAVSGNDRTLCLGCHSAPRATYPGEATYAVGAHGLSAKTVTITAAWASGEETRKAGECQSCHAPMGRTNGTGVVPKLADKAGRALCVTCHSASGPASSDISSTGYPASASAYAELAVSFGPTSAPAAYARLALYSQVATVAPRPLAGPREIDLPSGAMGAGDLTDDGSTELVVAERGASRLRILVPDAFKGLRTVATRDIGLVADHLAVADVLPGVPGDEVAVVDAAADELVLYSYDGSDLSTVAGPFAIGGDASGLASGDVTGGASPDLVVTTRADDAFRVLTGSGSSATMSAAFSTLRDPTGPSIGDIRADGGKAEIAIANAGETTAAVSLYDGSGGVLGDYDDGSGSGVPAATAVGELMTGLAGATRPEVAVVRDGGSGAGALVVLATDSGGDLVPMAERALRSGGRALVVEVGDADGDGDADVLVGGAGRSASAGVQVPPAVDIFRANGASDDLESAAWRTLWGGGTELAGGAPAIVLADLGPAGPSRHPDEAAPSSHVSTEVTPVERHVACVDCHDVHEATSTPAAAPAVYGALKGSWGVSVSNLSTSSIEYTERRGIAYEYELCFKCHSGWADLRGGRNIAFEVNALNPSKHAVEETAATSDATADSFQTGWGTSSVLHCTDCHGRSGSGDGERLLHESTAGPLLRRPYAGARPDDGRLLCYRCHRPDVYLDGTADSGSSASRFGSVATPALHASHVGTRGFSCASCHVSHGSSYLPRLMRDDLGYQAETAPERASCTGPCHAGGARRSY